MKAVIEVALGQEPSNLEPVISQYCIERAIITKPGIVKKIIGLEEALKISGIKEIFLNVKPGDKVIQPRSNVEKAGHIIAIGKTLDEAVKRAMAVKEIKNKDAIRAWKNMFAQNGIITRDATGTYVSPKIIENNTVIVPVTTQVAALTEIKKE